MGRLLLLVYCTVSVISKVVFWRSSMAAADRKRLNQLMKRASSVLGVLWMPWRTLSQLCSSFSRRLVPPRV